MVSSIPWWSCHDVFFGLQFCVLPALSFYIIEDIKSKYLPVCTGRDWVLIHPTQTLSSYYQMTIMTVVPS